MKTYNHKPLLPSLTAALFLSLLLTACGGSKSDKTDDQAAAVDTLTLPQEKHLKNMRQITFGGNNAEAYWSFDNKYLIFQSDWSQITKQGCDQIFTVNAFGKPQYKLISTDSGRTTCSYFMPDGRMVFASTHEAAAECPNAAPITNGKYTWAVYETFDIYIYDPKTDSTKLLIGGKGYDAEATVSPDGKYIVFTSDRSGDLELYRYEIATGEIIQLTHELGYDGGAFFSPDSKKIVWRTSRPKDAASQQVYKQLLAEHRVQPTEMNIYVMDVDGKNQKQVTDLPGANWAPFFHPKGNKILFSSNHLSAGKGRPRFNIFMINLDGSGLEQVTFSEVFDAFPMFSFDGKYLAFSSNRNNGGGKDTNVFIAEWVD